MINKTIFYYWNICTKTGKWAVMCVYACVCACVCVCVVSILLLFLWSFYCILELFRQYGICFSFYHCNCTRALFGFLMCYRRLGHSKYCYLLCVTLFGFYIRHSFNILTKIKKYKKYLFMATCLKAWLDNNWFCTIILLICCSLFFSVWPLHFLDLFTASHQPFDIFKLFVVGKF